MLGLTFSACFRSAYLIFPRVIVFVFSSWRNLYSSGDFCNCFALVCVYFLPTMVYFV